MAQQIPPPDLQTAIQLWKSNQRDQSRSMLQALVKAQPADESAWLWLARTAESRDMQYQALLRVLELNPYNDIAQRVLRERFPSYGEQKAQIDDLFAEATFADDWPQAESLYLRILELDPAHADSIDAMLAHYAKAGQWREGFRTLDDCLNRLPNDHLLVGRQVEFALKAEDLGYLRMVDETLLNHPAVKVEQLMKAGELFAKDKQYDVVAHLLARVARLEPENQTVLYGLAHAYDVTDRPQLAKQIRQRITDVDRHSTLGQRMMNLMLEEDPYVPLSMRENTWLAVREAVGLALPIFVLMFMDNGLSFAGADRILGVALAFVGGYLLVTATSSHEQKVWKRLLPEGLDTPTRYVMGAVGALTVAFALYLALRTSLDRSSDLATWEDEACFELIALVEENVELEDDNNPLRDTQPCEWLRGLFYVEPE